MNSTPSDKHTSRMNGRSKRSALDDRNDSDLDNEDEEIDVKKLKANFDEQHQIMAVVEEFEDDYHNYKH